MDNFRNKYRIKSARLQNWDYGWNGAYYITICTKNRIKYFGKIIDGKAKLSEIGEIALKCLKEIPQRFLYAQLDKFVIMPNHVHVIIIINKNEIFSDNIRKDNSRDAINRVSTWNVPLKKGGITGDKNPMLNENISRILNWYSGRVTFESRKINSDFAWQSRFYDHLIRNENSLRQIQHYIINNPLSWDDDPLRY